MKYQHSIIAIGFLVSSFPSYGDVFEPNENPKYPISYSVTNTSNYQRSFWCEFQYSIIEVSFRDYRIVKSDLKLSHVESCQLLQHILENTE